MYKLSIKNEVNGREYGATFESKEEKNAWLDECINKEKWGKNQREIPKDEVPAELESRIIDFSNKVEFRELDGEEIEVVVEYVTLKPDYIITESNLNLSKTHRNQKKKELRKSEYPSLEEILHIILDHGADSPEYAALQEQRAAIKAKYPLE